MGFVYSVHPTSDNIDPAKSFGEIKYINQRYVFGDEIDNGVLPAAFLHHIGQAASQFNPVDDYILINGDHLQVVAFIALLAAKHDQFQVLRWDRKASAYIPVWISTF